MWRLCATQLSVFLHLVVAAPARKYAAAAAAAPVPVRKAAAPIVVIRTAVGTSVVVEVRERLANVRARQRRRKPIKCFIPPRR